MLAQSPTTGAAPSDGAYVQNPAGILAVLLAVLAVVFWAAGQPRIGRVFKVIPPLVLCYFLPTALRGWGVIPPESPFYEWVKQFILPASLLLLTLSLDVKGIVRLGPKAGIVFLAGTAGVVIGGPITLLIWQGRLPHDAWRVMSYLAGSWIGGSANGMALSRMCQVPDAALGPVIVVDAALANIWFGLLLYIAGRHAGLDRWLGGDASTITRLEARLEEYHRKVARKASADDWIKILALAFGGAWLSHAAGQWLLTLGPIAAMGEYLNAFAWTVILATTFGVLLSFTKARELEGAGASTIGTVMIYLLVTCIGAGADFDRLLHGEAGYYLAAGVTWILIHGAVMLLVAKLIRAPFFFVAVGSQANIGGAASAPLVAGAFNPVLAPVGVLLAIAGYVLGTYAGMLCTILCRAVAKSG
ncbi:MAG TPA: DUF819 family protein [Phycisphaerae bacterium]|nr:DUF819 family protein [Phycisphaerae bacterium]